MDLRISEPAERLLDDLRAAVSARPDSARSFVIPLNINATEIPIVHPGFGDQHRLAARGLVDELVQTGLLRRVAPGDTRNWRHELTPAGYAYRSPRSPRGLLSRLSIKVRWLIALIVGMVALLGGLATLLSFLGFGPSP